MRENTAKFMPQYLSSTWHHYPNIPKELADCLVDKDGDIVATNMRLPLPVCDRLVYPDLVIIDDEPVLKDDEYLDSCLNPTAIIEIRLKSPVHDLLTLSPPS